MIKALNKWIRSTPVVTSLPLACWFTCTCFNPVTHAATYTWLGNSTGVPSPITLPIDYLNSSPFSALGNWRVNGSVPILVPDENDDIVFSTFAEDDYDVAFAQNRTVNKWTVLGTYAGAARISNGAPPNLTPTLTLVSGQYSHQNNQAFHFDVNLALGGAGSIYIDPGASTFISGALIAPGGLTKSGSGYLEIAPTSIIGNAFTIEDGKVYVNNDLNQHTANIGTLVIGDGIGGDRSAGYRGTLAIPLGTSVTIKRDGELTTVRPAGSGISYGNVHMQGGYVVAENFDFQPQSLTMTAAIDSGTIGTVAARIFSVANSEANLLHLLPNNGTISDLNVTHLAAAPVDARLGIPIVADQFRLIGGGILEIAPQITGGSNQTQQPNQISRTLVSNGTLILNRGNNLDLLGSTVVVGGVGSNAQVRLATANQLNDDAFLTVGLLGSLDLNGFSDTIGALNLNGGAVSTGAGTLKLTTPLTPVGNGATSSISGNLAIAAAGHTFQVDTTSTLTLQNISVTGGPIIKTGLGTMLLSGTPAPSTDFDVRAGLLKSLSGMSIGDLKLTGGEVSIAGAFLTPTSVIFAGPGILSSSSGGALRTNLISATENGGNLTVPIDNQNGFLTISVSSSKTLSMSSQLSNNTAVLKTGNGTLGLDNPNFSQLQIDAGRVYVKSGSMVLNALTAADGTQLDIASEAILSMPVLRAGSVSAKLTGSGTFYVSGAANISTFSGSEANTIASIQALNGTLHLNKTPYIAAIGGNLTIDAPANVIADASGQFAPTSTLNVKGGQLALGSTAHLLSAINMTGGTIEDGLFITNNGVSVSNGTLDVTTISVLSGGLNITGTSRVEFQAASSVSGLTSLNSLSTLSVDFSSNLLVGATLEDTIFASGSRIRLFPDVAADKAIIDINGPFLVGTPITSVIVFPVPSIQLVGMAGQAAIDLSGVGPLPNGAYKLIDFSDGIFSQAGVNGSLFPTLNNFVLIPPAHGQGSLIINNNVLTYVAVPEPSQLVTIGLTALAFLRRRSRRSV